MNFTVERIGSALKEADFLVDEGAIQQLTHFLNALLLWNKAYNLTAITDPEEVLVKHLFDSLILQEHLLEKCAKGRLIDVGSGAGLPGIPLSIAMPGHEFVLLDSSQKRTRFMQQMVFELKLKNVEVIHSRVQDYQPSEGFNIVLSRAFASATDMIHWSEHLLKKAGYFAAMKGQINPAEWRAIPETYPNIETIALNVPQLNEARHLVFLSR